MMVYALPQWYIWLVYAIFSTVVFITADTMRRRFVEHRIVATHLGDKLLKLEKELEWWKQAHLKLQGQVVRGREILYERLKVPDDKQDEDALIDTDDNIYAQVRCQSCGKNKVTIIKNQPYFGIICEECRNANKGWVKS